MQCLLYYLALSVVWRPPIRVSGTETLLPSYPLPMSHAHVEPGDLRRSPYGAMFGAEPTQFIGREDVQVKFEAPARLFRFSKALVVRCVAACADVLHSVGVRLILAANAVTSVAEEWHAQIERLAATSAAAVPQPVASTPRRMRYSDIPSRSRRIIATVVSSQLPPVMMTSAEAAHERDDHPSTMLPRMRDHRAPY